MKKILITENISQVGIEFLKRKGYDIHFSSDISEDGLIRDLADCEGLIVRIAPVTRKIIENAPHAEDHRKTRRRHG